MTLGNQQQWRWQRKIYTMHFCAIGIFRNLWQAPPATSWHLPPSAPPRSSCGHYVLFLTICHWLNLKTAWHCFNLPFTLHQGGTSPAMVEVLSIYSMKRKVSVSIWAALWILLVLQGSTIFKSFGPLHFRILTRTQFLWHQVVFVGRFMYINLNSVTQFRKKRIKINIITKLFPYFLSKKNNL